MLVLLTFRFLSRHFRFLSGFCTKKLGFYQAFVLVFQFLSGFCTGFSVSIRSLSSFFRPVGAAVSYYFRPVERAVALGAGCVLLLQTSVGTALSRFSACGEHSNRCRNTLRRRYSTIKWNGWQGATAVFRGHGLAAGDALCLAAVSTPVWATIMNPGKAER